MDINKIFLSSTISQSINEIINSNTSTIASKINKLNDLLNQYSSDLSNYQNEYQEGLSSEIGDGALFNRSDWRIMSPELIKKIAYYTKAINETNAAIQRLATKESHDSSRDKILGNVVSAAPLAQGAIEKIKEFYKKHAVRRGTSDTNSRSIRDLGRRASDKVKRWLNRNASDAADDDAKSESSVSDPDGSLVNNADKMEDTEALDKALDTLKEDTNEYDSGEAAEAESYADEAQYNPLDVMEDWFGDAAEHRLYNEGRAAYARSHSALRTAIERETNIVKDYKSDLKMDDDPTDIPDDVSDVLADADDILDYSYGVDDALADSDAIVSDILDGIEDFLPDILDFI